MFHIRARGAASRKRRMTETASASPQNNTVRRSGRAAGVNWPSRSQKATSDGTENQCVNLRLRANSVTAIDSDLGRTHSSAPATKVTKMS